jgi:hypothetical protein
MSTTFSPFKIVYGQMNFRGVTYLIDFPIDMKISNVVKAFAKHME